MRTPASFLFADIRYELSGGPPCEWPACVRVCVADILAEKRFNGLRAAGRAWRGPDAVVCDLRVLSTWAWHLKANGIVDGRSECICKGRPKMAGDTRVPQRGRGVSGIELTGRRHAVFGLLADLSLSVPYQATIGIGGLDALNKESELFCFFSEFGVLIILQAGNAGHHARHAT
jgi:hypothetical protein